MLDRYFKANDRIQEALDRLYVQQLSRILSIGAFYYLVISVAHLFFVPRDILIPLISSSLATAIVSVIIRIAVLRGVLTPKQCRYAFIPTGILGSVAVYLHVYLSGDILQLTNNALIMFVICMATLSVRIFLGFLALTAGLYIYVMLQLGGPLVGHFAFLLFGTTVVSIMGFMVRYKALYSAEELALENADKAARLEEANKLVERKRADAEKAVEEARRANIAKDAFLANTTHELRTPLTGVLGMLDVLETTALTKEQEETVSAAQFSARSLLVIINDLLDIAKIEAGKFEFRTRSFDLEVILQQVKGLLLPKAQNKKNVLIIKRLTGPRKTFLEGDPVRVGQVLFNLIDNAIKFTDEGSVVVSTQLTVEGDFAHVSCSVKDQGVGFHAEEAEKLFQRFGQIDDTSTTSTGGTGLGLPISRELARLMDGDVVAEAIPGEGATFTFTAKFKLSDEQEATKSAVQTEVLPSISKAPLRVLIAEDVSINQMLIEKLLAKHAWQLEFADDGQIALEKIEANPPYDFILMDIRMPRMDGAQVIHAVQGMEKAKADVPIIALTANAGPDDRASYLRIGAAAVVGKPIKERKLAEAINRLVSVKA
ncbi:ATP-binding protein [Kordiimonas laminariae]|uniref:ATP-binding protein n=1 Tax=Kordiimonas laminariae TaxID=2917717 RepID=UPI001FF65068|nr:ATP-binding protein [Kordiimonas laminariae]MCK0068421.1 ATP-binding protein [Kordiimonas laminariae]